MSNKKGDKISYNMDSSDWLTQTRCEDVKLYHSLTDSGDSFEKWIIFGDIFENTKLLLESKARNYHMFV